MKKMVGLLQLNYTKYYASLRFIKGSASEHTQNILENELTRGLEISKQELTRLQRAEFVANFESEIEAAYNEEKDREVKQPQSVPSDAPEAGPSEAEPVHIDLDQLIREEESKRYWAEFGEQLANNDFGRVVELCPLPEKLTPRKVRYYPVDDRQSQLDIGMSRPVVNSWSYGDQ
eukprot:271964_1